MKNLAVFLIAGVLALCAGAAVAQTIPVEHFHKVIVSPYIQASFVQGDAESVTINSCIVDTGKLHLEQHGGVLRVYLDGARDIPHGTRQYVYDENGGRHELYPRHAVLVTITYRRLDELSLRGEERYLCESPLYANRFHLRLYGDATMLFTEVHISKLFSKVYGESNVEIRSGDIGKQYYTCFGDSKINSTAIRSRAAKVTSFGDAEFRVNVSDRIRLMAFGDAKLWYMGNPAIAKGFHFGDLDVKRLD